jgi:uncharacterized membrane protein
VSFANPIPWWALAAIVLSAAAVAWFAYSRRRLDPKRRFMLSALRFVTLLALVVFLLRPVTSNPDDGGSGVVVPVLVDTSRSMSIEDAGGARRIDRARQLIVERLLPSLSSRFTIEVLSFGETVAAADPKQLSSSARQSDLEGALTAVRTRYQGRPVAGIVLVSDGGDTSNRAERAAAESPPIFAIGIGAPVAGKDREVLSVAAADRTLDDSRVDLEVSAVSHGLGTTPIELRLFENGRPVDVRRATPVGDGTPVREVFQVTPARGAPAVYTVETPAAPGELVPENNARSVLVQAPTRSRRVLLVEGAPGFEHSFLRRAWGSDSGLEIDAVVKKGRDDQGSDTYYVQAARSRSDNLTAGYPPTREALFVYDALVLANVEGHQFTRAQLEAARAFVGQRGGGLLVLGTRSFLSRGLVDTPLEEVLPLDLSDQGGVVSAAASPGPNRVSLTTAGEAHPVMQLAPAFDETRRRWDALPALASVATIGGPRPGASVLAVSGGPGGTPRPLVAVQRFGEGRAMIFAGEASWRWRMMMPAADRSFETFWRQALRWLASSATDPVHITVPQGPPGIAAPLRIVVRNAAFEPQAGATLTVRVTTPDGRSESVSPVPETGADAAGRFVAEYRPAVAGVYRITADAKSGTGVLGSASASMLVGGADLEMTDPRLNRQALERVALASGGRLVDEDQLGTLGDMLKGLVPAAELSVRRDLWHNVWSFAAILALLAAEWVLRRRWGWR